MKAGSLALLGLVFALLVAASAEPDAAQARPAARAPVAPRNAPLLFIENAGQFDDHARFQARMGSATLWLAQDALWVTVLQPNPPSPLPEREGGASRPSPNRGGAGGEVRGVNVKLSFAGANPHPRLESFNRLDTYVSYFLGNDPTKWRADVPVWGGVRYVDLYPEIDLELRGKEGLPGLQDLAGLRLIAQPGADLSIVRLQIEGADALTLDGDRLRLTTAVGEFSLPPILTGDGAPLRPTIADGTITFASYPFPENQAESPVVGDSPSTLLYSTFLGGSGGIFGDMGAGIAVDTTGAAYVTGYTYSLDFPTTPGAFQTGHGGGQIDVFITKMNPPGSALVYSTYLGGSYSELGYSIAVDASGAATVAGFTNSFFDFPVTPGAFQTIYGGSQTDGFVTKLNPTGSALVYSTYLGGSGTDQATSIAVDAGGAATITGYTTSSNFPLTPGAYDPTCGGCTSGYFDAFVTRLNTVGSALAYSTFLGGSGGDYGHEIVLDATGAATVVGQTWASDFPTTPGAAQPAYGGGEYDAFVTRLNTDGSALAYSTYLGGNDHDVGYGVAIDANGAATVAGQTESSDFPITPGAYDPTCGCDPFNGIGDAFVTKLSVDGDAFVYSTFLGGSRGDTGYDVAVDVNGAANVIGRTFSTDFPTTPGAFQPNLGGGICLGQPCPDAFVTRLNLDGSGLAYSTFLGGSHYDCNFGRCAITLDSTGAAYLIGSTHSADFPTTSGAFQTTLGGGMCQGMPCPDAFVAKLDMGLLATPTPPATATHTPVPTHTPTPTPPAPSHSLYLPLVLRDR